MDVLGTVAVRNGAAGAVRNGVDGHLNGPGNGNGTATWSDLAPATRAGAVRFLSAYEAPPERGLYLRAGKRLLDVVGAIVALILSSPLLLFAAILIKLESRGPVVYKSVRIGRGARPFTFFKLRTMVDGADRHRHTLSHLNETDGPVFKMTRDPRVTRIGRWLRVTSLDEIPQLWNVLRGDMSLVGPRPPIAEEVVQYEPWQLRRLDVLPGLTCLWQISGRSRIGFQEWMRLDLEYIKHRSFWLDLKILIRTIPAVLSREGAY
jgi:lipopolysaccharide/colanic/teichoic acid biosynthesis glycosyltransferase